MRPALKILLFSLVVLFTLLPFTSACQINCTNNWDCGPGELCLNAGMCDMAYCQPVNKTVEAALRNASTNGTLVLQGLLGIRPEEEGDTLVLTVINANYDSVENVSFTVLFPSVPAENLHPWKRHGGVSHRVFDGGVTFFVKQIATADLVSVRVDKGLMNQTNWSIENITYASYEEMEYAELDYSAIVSAREKFLDVWVNSSYNGSFTKVEIALDPHMRLSGVAVPVEIPKCMALYARELQLGGEYVILRDDPLIVWQFADVAVPETISFFVPKEIPADCLEQVSVGVVVSSAKKGLPAWLTLAIIPLIAVILLFFQQFGKNRRQ